MHLSEYVSAERGRASALASKLGISTAFVSQMAKGDRFVPPAIAVQIESATGGEVTRQDLRPDDWRAIWPELAKRKRATATQTDKAA